MLFFAPLRVLRGYRKLVGWLVGQEKTKPSIPLAILLVIAVFLSTFYFLLSTFYFPLSYPFRAQVPVPGTGTRSGHRLSTFLPVPGTSLSSLRIKALKAKRLRILQKATAYEMIGGTATGLYHFLSLFSSGRA